MGTKTIWDGKDLPRIGDEVLIELSSIKDRLIRHKVTGYEIKDPVDDLAMTKNLHRVFIKLAPADGERASSDNCRLLNDVYPLTGKPL